MPAVKKILFVCTGNICRSPTAEGVFNKLVADVGLSKLIKAESAGTHGFHAGNAPDKRAQDLAKSRGYNLARLRARRIEKEDLDRFDLVLAMDRDHFDLLNAMRMNTARATIRMMLDYGTPSVKRGMDSVPDPYGGGQDDFMRAFDLIEDAANGLLYALRVELGDLPAVSQSNR